jgi:hypothetical protein
MQNNVFNYYDIASALRLFDQICMQSFDEAATTVV